MIGKKEIAASWRDIPLLPKTLKCNQERFGAIYFNRFTNKNRFDFRKEIIFFLIWDYSYRISNGFTHFI